MKNYTLAIMMSLLCLAAFAQDVVPNASFESWTNTGIYLNPTGWNTLNSDLSILGVLGVQRDSLIVHSGLYSARVESYYISVISQVAPGILTTGTIDSTTQAIGHGIPVHSRPGSLNGWYQYAYTAAGDTAYASISLFSSGVQVGTGTVYFYSATGSWTHFTVPVTYSSGIMPDSVQLTFFSGNYNGSTLWVDDLSYTAGVSLGPDQTVCINSHVILDPVTTGLSAPLKYFWQSTGNQLSCDTCLYPSVTITQNSTYILNVIDAQNIVSADTVNYFINANTSTLQTSATSTGISCYQPLDTTTATLINGTAPYTINWGDGYTNTGYGSPSAYSYHAGGVYVLSATDAQGCVSAVLDTIIDTAVVAGLVSAIRPECPNSSNGAITINVTGGQPPYTYLWSNGSTVASPGGLPPGIYSASITDVNNCSTQFAYNIPALTYIYTYITTTSTNCGSNGSALATVFGGTQPYTYQWSNNDSTCCAGRPGRWQLQLNSNRCQGLRGKR